jgi:hypothetical protein
MVRRGDLQVVLEFSKQNRVAQMSQQIKPFYEFASFRLDAASCVFGPILVCNDRKSVPAIAKTVSEVI